MKKFFLFIVLFVAFFAVFTTLGSSDNPSSKKTAEVTTTVKADGAPDDSTTRKAICDLFENNGLKIKRVMHQPLIEKDQGLYGGEERWWITLEDGEQIVSWVCDGKITFCHGGNEYNEIPLY